ncbi:hypothetical protein C8Q80DRAFT_1266939 [Daedaleopsis nitida]|nr:hypothetical protein C8Q80DRAFT_1266939 [Daedaleopsis nitida]
MNPFLETPLYFVVLGESCVILILFIVLLFLCWTTRRLRRKTEMLKKIIEQTPRPASGMRLINYSPALRSYGWNGDDAASAVTTGYYPEGRLTATTTTSYNSMHPLISKPSDLSDKAETSPPPEQQTFSTYGDYYRAMSSMPPGGSPHSSTTLVPPPSPAHIRTHEPSRLAASTLPDNTDERTPTARRTHERDDNNRAGVGVSFRMVVSTDHEGRSTSTLVRSPSMRTITPSDVPSTPPRTSPPIPAIPPTPTTPPHSRDTFGHGENNGVPSSPPAARRGVRSRSASTSTSTPRRPTDTPPRDGLRRGLSDASRQPHAESHVDVFAKNPPVIGGRSPSRGRGSVKKTKSPKKSEESVVSGGSPRSPSKSVFSRANVRDTSGPGAADLVSYFDD